MLSCYSESLFSIIDFSKNLYGILILLINPILKNILSVSSINSINLDILLHDVEPNIVLCLLHVKYKNCSALVSPT